MKQLLTVCILCLTSIAAFAQGTLNFVTKITGTLDAPAFDTDGVTRLAGTGFKAQVYAGPSESALTAVGASVNFRTGAGAGYVDTSAGSTREIPTVAPGNPAYVQVRAWDATKGSTYEQAQAAGGKTGASLTIRVTAGGGLLPPANLIGLASFKLQQVSKPVIQSHPVSVVAGAGATVKFQVTATGSTPLQYQWRKDNKTDVAGATSATLELANISAANAGSYTVRVSNNQGSTESNPATLTIAPIPAITKITVTPNPAQVGKPLKLEVAAEGTGPLTYQWTFNGSALGGATGVAYETVSASAGVYGIRVTGPGGAASRDAVTVSSQFVLERVVEQGGVILATPDQSTYTSGAKVSLLADPDDGFEFTGWSGDASGTANPTVVTMNGHKRVEALFRATGGTVYFANRSLGAGIDAPVLDVDGKTPLSGDAFVAQLYAGPTGDTLAAVGDPIPFRDGDGAGYFFSEIRAIPSVPPGKTAVVQVRAWQASAGKTFEAAVAANGKQGSSEPLSLVTGNAGSPPSLPTFLIGLTSFQLRLSSPPSITKHPAPVSIHTGGTAVFEVTAVGSEPLTYAWKKNGSPVDGATTRRLELKNVSASDVAGYSVRVSNAFGHADSTEAKLTLTAPIPLTLTVQESEGGSVTVAPSQSTYLSGSTVQLTATADAGFAFSSWSGDLSGTQNPASLTMDANKTVKPVFAATGGTVYFANRVLGAGIDAPVFDIDGKTPLSGDGFVAQLYAGPTESTLAPAGPPSPFRSGDGAGYFLSVTRAIATVAPGQPAWVEVRAWQKSAGATFEAAADANGKTGTSARLKVTTGNAGNPPSLPANLVGLASFQLRQASIPVITGQPKAVSVALGASATFEVTATGSTPFSYAWSKNGSPIDGATGRTFTIAKVSESDAANYSVRVTNAKGFADSQPAALTLLRAPNIVKVNILPNPPEAGKRLRIEVTAEGTAPFTYQWTRNGTLIAGANGPVLERASAELGQYSIRIAGAGGSTFRDLVEVSSRFVLTLQVEQGGEIVADPSGPNYAPGTPVQLRAVADPGYSFTGWSSDVSGTANPTSVTMNGHKTVVATFKPTGGTIFFANRSLATGIDAPIFDTDGTTRLEGSKFRAQLFAGPTPDGLEAIGEPAEFRTGEGAGYFFSGIRSIPTVSPGGTAYVQVRAWKVSGDDDDDEDDTDDGDDSDSYAKAIETSHRTGASAMITVVTGNAGSPPSLPAYLTGLASFKLGKGVAPEITKEPVAVSVSVGQTAEFSVVATGTPEPQFQWRKGGKEIDGATKATLSFAAVTPDDTGLYTVRVYNSAGSVESKPVALKVLTAPAVFILAPPGSIVAGEHANLLAVATGAKPLTFHWYQGAKGDTSTPVGENSAEFESEPLRESTAFWVRVSNSIGTADSDAITVTVTRKPQTIAFAPQPPVVLGGSPAELSARASSGLPVTFSLVSGPATLDGNILTPTATGVARVRATQEGNASYLPAPAVEQEISLLKGKAIILLTRLQQMADGTPKQPDVSVTPAGLPVVLTFEGLSGPPTAPGTYTVRATVDDPNYSGRATARFELTGGFNLVGTVFRDLNADGDRDEGETGIEGVPIQLLKLDATTVLRSTSTDSKGAFSFAGLDGGGYYVREENLSGYVSTTPDLRLLTVRSGVVTEVVFGDQPESAITGVVFEDVDGDGHRASGEAGLPGVTIQLSGSGITRSTQSKTDGTFEFLNVGSGNYSLEEIDPSGFASTTPNVRQVSVAPGGSATASFGDQAVATIGGSVYVDLNGNGSREESEPGLGGVTVRLTGDSSIASATTGDDGSFLFKEIAPGTYTIEEFDPIGYTSTTPNVRTLNLTTGGSATASFGDQAAGTVAGVVFEDKNGNGSADTGEPGIASVVVRLSGLGSTRSALSDGNGAFSFSGIAPGTYSVEESDPIGFMSTTPNTRSVTLASGGSATAHFGDQAAGGVSGFVFDDKDGNGLRDDGEAGIGGVSVRLIGGTGQRTAVTSGDGAYHFSNVDPGSYSVEETDPLGYVSTTPNLRPISLASGGSANADFGDQSVGTVAGTVFEDANGDGAHDSGEAGLGGVTVRLVGNGAQRTTSTTGDGSYQFTGVTPGTYSVEEIDPIGFSSTTPNLRTVSVGSGGSASASFGDQASGTVSGAVFDDLNGNGLQETGEPGLGGVVLRLGSSTGNRTTTSQGDGSFAFGSVEPGAYTLEEIDPAGYSSTTPNVRSLTLASGGAASATFGDQAAGSVAGVVFADANGNGLRDETETGIGGVTLRLSGNGGTRTTTSSGDGTYQFTGLVPGTYSVEETDPVGFASTTPNLRAVSLASGGAASASFGDQAVETISGVVFEDQNGNNTFDTGEPGIGGVTLVLLRASDESVVRETTSSGTGLFVFSDVPAGDYFVRQSVPDAYTVLTTGGAPAKASLHGAPTTPDFVTKSVQLLDGGAASVSFGNNVSGQLSGLVYDDLDGDGQPGASEPGLGGVSVEVRNAQTGAVVASGTTSGSGVYVIGNLAAGSYQVVQAAVTGYSTAQSSQTVSLATQGAAVANFANRASGTLSGRVFNDANGDGSADSGETGLGGVIIALVPQGGTRRETITAGDGSFLFTAVGAGTYNVEQTVPTGFTATTPTTVAVTIAANGAGSAVFGAQSTLVQPPSITTEPLDLALAPGANATLTAQAAGSGALTFQWLKDGTPIPGATAASLTLSAAQATDAGLYQLRVVNAAGTALSRVARVTVGGTSAYTSWAATQNLPAGKQRAGDDADGDGLDNLLEYFLGSAPLSAASGTLPEGVVVSRNSQAFVGFTVTRSRSALGVRAYLEASLDLTHWTAIETLVENAGTDAIGDVLHVLDATPTSSRPYRFVRLAVEETVQNAAPARVTVVSGPPIAASFQLSIEGTPGTTYAVEWSTDLVTWTFLRTVTTGSEAVLVTDDQTTGNRYRFYRATAR